MAETPVVPRTTDLARDAILQSMFDHVSEYDKKYPLIKIDVLKEKVLRQVIDAPKSDNNTKFNPEIQLRGFLKAFEDTPTFKAQFDILDNATKGQISAFKNDDKNQKWQNTIKNGFRFPDINPNVAKVLTGRSSSPSLFVKVRDLVLRGFVDVARPVVRLLVRLQMGRATTKLRAAQATKYAGGPKIYEDDSQQKIMDVFSGLPFGNWGQSVSNKPKYTFVPTTVRGIQHLVLYAKQNSLRVRCGGYRHSWSNTFSQNEEIFISLLPIVQVTNLPDPTSIRPTGQVDKPTELNDIVLLPENKETPLKRLCRLGVAVTNEGFRLWAIRNGWTLPVDVILVEVTIGGVNGPICHGAGAEHKTVSDYVRAVEYVDANGKLQEITNRDHLKAAAGCFGLLGIVTHITFELDKMVYAQLKPRKVDVARAIPPLDIGEIPLALRDDSWDKPGYKKELEDCRKEFERRAATDYYSEWFWFTFQQKVWVNTWDKTTDSKDVTDYPDSESVFFQWLQGWIGGIITETYFFQELPGAWQAQILATLGMAVLPPVDGEDAEPQFKTHLPNALHFRRGIQNMRVRDMEFQIPIPDKDGKPDFSVVQKAWWDVINLVYATSGNTASDSFLKSLVRTLTRKDSDKHTPMRLTLELRIMGGSDLLMAPQAGNKLTASIEVLTVPDAQHDGEWEAFKQAVCDRWMSYTDNSDTPMRLNVRPHWAKEWESLKMGPGRLDARQYLRTEGYRGPIAEFKRTLGEIGEGQDWTLKDLQARFSNELWDEIVYS